MNIHILYFVGGDGFTWSADCPVAYYLDGEKAEIIQISLNDKVKPWLEELHTMRDRLEKKKRDADWTPYHELRRKYNDEFFAYASKEFEIDLKEKKYEDIISDGYFHIDTHPINE